MDDRAKVCLDVQVPAKAAVGERVLAQLYEKAPFHAGTVWARASGTDRKATTYVKAMVESIMAIKLSNVGGERVN